MPGREQVPREKEVPPTPRSTISTITRETRVLNGFKESSNGSLV